MILILIFAWVNTRVSYLSLQGGVHVTCEQGTCFWSGSGGFRGGGNFCHRKPTRQRAAGVAAVQVGYTQARATLANYSVNRGGVWW